MPDVAIIGGGPVGVAAAAFLAQAGVDVVVLEERAQRSTRSRAIGLHPPALTALEPLGVVEECVASGVKITRGIGLSGGKKIGSLSFDRPGTRYRFVLSLPQVRTQAILDRALEREAPGALQLGSPVSAVRRASGRFDVSVDHRLDVLSVPVVLGADGSNGMMRAMSNAAVRSRSYRSSYVMADFADDGHFATDAALFFERAGVVESFPLPGERRRWVAHWTRAVHPPTAEGLAGEIHRRTGISLDPSSAEGQSSFDPHRSIVRVAHGDGVYLIGDAAHEISPIGGQGMNLGILDARAIVDPVRRLLASMERRSGSVEALENLQACVTERLRAARRSARLAELNMLLGSALPDTPVGRITHRLRRQVIGSLAASPASSFLAGAYSMQSESQVASFRICR